MNLAQYTPKLASLAVCTRLPSSPHQPETGVATRKWKSRGERAFTGTSMADEDHVELALERLATWKKGCDKFFRFVTCTYSSIRKSIH